MELNDKIYGGELVLAYGKLLTPKQLNAVKNYYLLDLGLSEIAENEGISRQGAYDLVSKSTRVLTLTEQKLGIVALKRRLNSSLSELINLSHEAEIKQKIQKIKNMLE